MKVKSAVNKYDLQIGDEVITVEGGPSRTYIIISYKPGDNWAVVLTKPDGWQYALKANTLIPTGQKYSFSESLKKELSDALTYSFNISKKLLSPPHLTLVSK